MSSKKLSQYYSAYLEVFNIEIEGDLTNDLSKHINKWLNFILRKALIYCHESGKLIIDKQIIAYSLPNIEAKDKPLISLNIVREVASEIIRKNGKDDYSISMEASELLVKPVDQFIRVYFKILIDKAEKGLTAIFDESIYFTNINKNLYKAKTLSNIEFDDIIDSALTKGLKCLKMKDNFSKKGRNISDFEDVEFSTAAIEKINQIANAIYSSLVEQVNRFHIIKKDFGHLAETFQNAIKIIFPYNLAVDTINSISNGADKLTLLNKGINKSLKDKYGTKDDWIIKYVNAIIQYLIVRVCLVAATVTLDNDIHMIGTDDIGQRDLDMLKLFSAVGIEL